MLIRVHSKEKEAMMVRKQKELELIAKIRKEVQAFLTKELLYISIMSKNNNWKDKSVLVPIKSLNHSETHKKVRYGEKMPFKDSRENNRPLSKILVQGSIISNQEQVHNTKLIHLQHLFLKLWEHILIKWYIKPIRILKLSWECRQNTNLHNQDQVYTILLISMKNTHRRIFLDTKRDLKKKR